MTGSTPAKRASWRCRVAAWSLALLAVSAVAACSDFGGRENSYTCPATTTVPDLQTLVTLVPGPNGATIQSSGRIGSVTADCDREGDNGVISKLTIEFAGLRTTPAINQLDLPYFVAVADANGNILDKQPFTMVLHFDPDEPVVKGADNISVHLPLKNAQLGNVYTIVVGFQLTKSQLDYNRAHLQ